MATGREHEQRVLAGRVRHITRAVANGSPTGLARVLNGLAPDDSSSRADALGRHIENDRRQVSRWLAGSMLMEEPSRIRLLAAANRVLGERGEPLFQPDYLTVREVDPIEEISRKLDLLLARLGPEERPIPASEAEAAFARAERAQSGGEPDGLNEQRSDGGTS